MIRNTFKGALEIHLKGHEIEAVGLYQALKCIQEMGPDEIIFEQGIKEMKPNSNNSTFH